MQLRTAVERLALLLPLLCVPACGGVRSAEGAFYDERSRRVVQAPTTFRWLSSQQTTGYLPASVSLGSRTSGRVILYFEFPGVRTSQRKLLGAFLMLEAAESRVSTSSVEVLLMRAEPTRADPRSWSEKPRNAEPRLPRVLLPRGAPLRLDVTELVLSDAEARRPTRFMLFAEPGDDDGVTLSTGAAGGAAPRLELYWE